MSATTPRRGRPAIERVAPMTPAAGLAEMTARINPRRTYPLGRHVDTSRPAGMDADTIARQVAAATPTPDFVGTW